MAYLHGIRRFWRARHQDERIERTGGSTVRKLLLAAAMATGMVVPFSPANAAEPAVYFGPPDTGPTGAMCWFVSATDPELTNGTVQTGELSGGPLIGDGALTCTIQVGSDTHLTTGNDAVTVSNSGSSLVTVGPYTVTFLAPTDVPVFLCTAFTPLGAPTLYWDALARQWSTDMNASCALSTTAGMDDSIFDEVRPVNDVFLQDFGTAQEGSLEVRALCQASLGTATGDPNAPVGYVVRGVAYASSSNGSIPVGTTIRCWLRQENPHFDWGPPVEGFGPFSTAAVVGTVFVGPERSRLTVCAEATGLFSPQQVVKYTTPGCES